MKHINKILILMYLFVANNYLAMEQETQNQDLDLSQFQNNPANLIQQCARKISDRLADDLINKRDYTNWLDLQKVPENLHQDILLALCKHHSDLLWQYLSDSISNTNIGASINQIYYNLVKINENGKYISTTAKMKRLSSVDVTKIWNTETNVQQFPDEHLKITDITQSIDGKLILIIFNYKVIYLTDIEKTRFINDTDNPNEYYKGIAISPDNEFFIIVSKNIQTDKLKINYWDMKTCKCKNSFEVDEKKMDAIQIYGKSVIIKTSESSILPQPSEFSFWKLNKKKCTNKLKAFDISLNGAVICHSYNSEKLSAFTLGYKDGDSKEYESDSPITCQVLGLRNKFAVTSFENGTCKIFKICKKSDREISAHETPIKSIVLSSDENILVTCAKENFVKIWNTETGKFLKILNTNSPILSLAVSFDNSTIAVGLEDGAAQIWKIDLNKNLEDVLEEIKSNINKLI